MKKVWTGLLSGVAFLILGLALPALGVVLPSEAIYSSGALGILILCWVVWREYQSPKETEAIGGEGGTARVSGRHSRAEGGAGGDARLGPGGRGGDATVNGDRSSAVGGKGGRGASG